MSKKNPIYVALVQEMNSVLAGVKRDIALIEAELEDSQSHDDVTVALAGIKALDGVAVRLEKRIRVLSERT